MAVSQARAGSGLQDVSGKPGHKGGQGSKSDTFTGLLAAVAATTATAHAPDPRGMPANPPSLGAFKNPRMEGGSAALGGEVGLRSESARSTPAPPPAAEAARPAAPATGPAPRKDPRPPTAPPVLAARTEPGSGMPPQGRAPTATSPEVPPWVDVPPAGGGHPAMAAAATNTSDFPPTAPGTPQPPPFPSEIETTVRLAKPSATRPSRTARLSYTEPARGSGSALQAGPSSRATTARTAHAHSIDSHRSLVIPPTALQALGAPTQVDAITAPLPNAVQATIGSQVTSALSGHLSTDGAGAGTTFELRVFPEDLGQVVVRISASGGVLSVHLSGTSAVLGQLLQASHHEIAASLQAGGSASVNIEFGLFGGNAYHGGGQRPPNSPASAPSNPAQPGSKGLGAPASAGPNEGHRLDLLA